jgi:hypothetical protein
MVRRLSAGGGSPLRTRLRKVKIPESGFVSILGWVLGDSGIVKRCFALIICRKSYPFPWRPAPRYPALSRCYRVCFAGWAWRRAGEFTVYNRSWLDHTNLNLALNLMFFSHLRVRSA